MSLEPDLLHARRATLIAAGVGLLVTLLVLDLGQVAVRSVPAKVAIDTFEASIALLAALLIGGRQRQHPSSSGRALMVALILFAGANLFFSVVPKIVGYGDPAVVAWTPVALRLLGAAAMAIGALAPEGFGATPRALLRSLLVAGAMIGAGLMAALLLAGHLPAPLPQVSPGMFRHPNVIGNPVLIASQGIIAILFATAAVGFTRKATIGADPFLKWVGAACALGAAARVNYFLFPSLYSDYVYTGDLLRMGYYLLLLTASIAQIAATWRALESMALVDQLTGLNSRHGLDVLGGFRIAQAQRMQQPVALVFMDLDHMKAINDTHGHTAGDQALVDAAAVIKGTFRDIDIIARVGGDEFCVLLADGADADQASARLQKTLGSYRAKHQRPYVLSLSTGVAVSPTAWNGDLVALIEEADAAMYLQKVTHHAAGQA